MLDDIVIELMTQDFILWRCLHRGPLSRDTIDQWPPDSQLPFERYRRRNIPLLEELTRVYGSCAIIARAGEQLIGQLRFYPKAVRELSGGDYLCLQQDFPFGPADDFAETGFPPFSQIKDKTLVVHCLMAGSVNQKGNPYQRKGIGSRMVKTLIEWARANGWERIEANAFEDIPIIYAITGSAGQSFWKKLALTLLIAVRIRNCKDLSMASLSKR
ncbi:GNAT family N-acetyltransferase [Candidatus Sumerlaeota bacterium]|nr:GNAT family N-acetyltransferase [Candidatus Sumerlaeota bacterium]